MTYSILDTITPTQSSNSNIRTFLPTELYLPEWARSTEFFRDIIILLNYTENSLLNFSNPKYAIVEQAYKDIAFKYKDIMQVSKEELQHLIVENGFGYILNALDLPLDRLQVIVLYIPLFKMLKGTDEGYKLLLSVIAKNVEIETWLDNPQELDEYTYNITSIAFINTGFNYNIITKFIEFSKNYVYPVLKNMTVKATFTGDSLVVHGRTIINPTIKVKCIYEPLS